jgi:hypothetical protein
MAASVETLLTALKVADEQINSIHKAFGAPGDHGYGTPEGKALYELYKSQLTIRSAIDAAESA